MQFRCQLCSASYIFLYDLVGHVRSAHSSDAHLSLVCQVNECPIVFTNTNTWYKHVVRQHKEAFESIPTVVVSCDREDNDGQSDGVESSTESDQDHAQFSGDEETDHNQGVQVSYQENADMDVDPFVDSCRCNQVVPPFYIS